MSARHEAVPKHPLTDRPAKFSDIPERVHRDAYWLAIQKRAAAEAERDAYKAALEVAADDLDKAANQFEAMRESQEAGYTVPISINPARFTEKAARARSVLAGVVSTREKDK